MPNYTCQKIAFVKAFSRSGNSILHRTAGMAVERQQEIPFFQMLQDCLNLDLLDLYTPEQKLTYLQLLSSPN